MLSPMNEIKINQELMNGLGLTAQAFNPSIPGAKAKAEAG